MNNKNNTILIYNYYNIVFYTICYYKIFVYLIFEKIIFFYWINIYWINISRFLDKIKENQMNWSNELHTYDVFKR